MSSPCRWFVNWRSIQRWSTSPDSSSAPARRHSERPFLTSPARPTGSWSAPGHGFAAAGAHRTAGMGPLVDKGRRTLCACPRLGPGAGRGPSGQSRRLAGDQWSAPSAAKYTPARCPERSADRATGAGDDRDRLHHVLRGRCGDAPADFTRIIEGRRGSPPTDSTHRIRGGRESCAWRRAGRCLTAFAADGGRCDHEPPRLKRRSLDFGAEDGETSEAIGPADLLEERPLVG
jgi:hypothetical protein